MIVAHRLPAGALGSVAGPEPGDEVLTVLSAGQLSKRYLLLRLVADGLAAGPAAGAARDALDLIAVAQRHSRPVVDSVIMYPHVGAGLVRCLRERRAGSTIHGVDYLRRLAAAVAFGAGVEFSLELDDAGGPVHLPGLGVARPEQIRRVRLESHGGERRVGRTALPEPDGSGATGSGWTPVRRVAAPAGRWTPALDDLDPHRGAGGLPAAERLADDQFDRWQSLFSQAGRSLIEHHAGWARQIRRILRAVTPLTPRIPGQGRSASTAQAYGAVALTPPANGRSLAATLVHETQHSKLNALIELTDLVDRDDRSLYYSPWRADPRPLLGLLHGCFAFAGVAEFWAGERAIDANSRHADYEFAYTVRQTGRALDTLAGASGLTADGHALVDGLARRIGALSTGTVAADVETLAGLAVDEHEVAWRLRSVMPEPAEVASLAAAWQAGTSASWHKSGTNVVAGSDTFVPNDRIRLWHRLGRDPTMDDGGPDALLATGDVAGAAHHYRRRIEADLDDTDAWTGLALAAARQPGPTARVWRDRPELIPAVYRAACATGADAPDPMRLAAWLRGGAGDGDGD